MAEYKGKTKDNCITKVIDYHKHSYDFGKGEICETITSDYKDSCYLIIHQCDKISVKPAMALCQKMFDECDEFVLDKEFDGYLKIDFSAGCPSLLTEAEEPDILLSYQNGGYDIGKEGETAMVFIKDGSYETTTYEDCMAFGLINSKFSGITPKGDKGVTCLHTPQDNQTYKLSVLSEDDEKVTLTFSVVEG